MLPQIIRFAEIVAVCGAFASMGYYALCVWSAIGFLRDRKNVGGGARSTLPSVSILKPLKGADPEMYDSFRSYCLQDYPEYEVIFGVSDANDPAIHLVERLEAEFPNCAIRLVACEKDLGSNIKVSNLVQMLPYAKHEHLIVNDSDIRVEPDYLCRVVFPLSDPQIGLVTCLYRGMAKPTLGSRLESIGISTDFSGGVLAALLVERGIRFGMGSTLAFRRGDLQSIGGFEGFVDYLADDYEIGSRIASRGLKVKLSEVVVETFLPSYSLREFMRHQLRWARSVRDSRRWGYVGIVLTFGLFWALLAVVLADGARWAWYLLAVVAMTRIAMAAIVGRLVLQDRQVTRWLILIPLRDLVAVVVWMASFMGHRIAWRGDYFILKDGKLARISP